MSELKYKRVLLKLSGEVLAGKQKTGVDVETVGKICDKIKEPGECGGLYTGEYEKEGFIGTYMLHNQALKSEHIMISCVNNLVNPGQQLALVSGLSNYTMLPVTFKAVISEKEIVNKEKLMNLLAFNKEDLKLMKQMNYLTIQNMR